MVYNAAGKVMTDYMKGVKDINTSGRGTIQFTSYYFALRCKHCGNWRAKRTKNPSSARSKCFVCNKETKLRLSNTYGFNMDYRKFKTMAETKAFVIEINGKRDEITKDL